MGQVSHHEASRPSAAGKTIFNYADELAVRVPTSCGRAGNCHECIVEIRKGREALTPPTKAESFLRGDYRLACQAAIQDPEPDIEFALLRRKSQILASSPLLWSDPGDRLVTRRGDDVLYDGERIDAFHGHLYGLAVDLGTTTIALRLLDLESGAVVFASSIDNPQRFGGSDVMNRISYDSGPFRGELHRSVINALNSEIRGMTAALGFRRDEIYEVVVAGNSTMRDLFFGLDVQSIGQRPYKSSVEHEFLAGSRATTSLTQLAHRLAILAHPKARIWSPPLIASHVGADTTAALMAIDMDSQTDVVMLVDVGTNTEVVLGNRHGMVAASCPAGPAFEGGLIRFGMPGCEGAIEAVRWQDGHAEYQTIGGGRPEGLCGSGLIDLLAELRRTGQMTPKGVFSERRYEIAVAPEYGITFSREDASHLAQAKAANYCGQFIVMREFGAAPAEIAKLYLSGGFANYIDVAHAVEIGFLAPLLLDRVEKVGNAALEGACRLLRSRSARESAERLVRRIRHVELETTPDFFDIFVEGCQFKPMPSPHGSQAMASPGR